MRPYNKGLNVVFRDPRVVEPVMSALDVEVDYGRLKGPLILEAEAGPNMITLVHSSDTSTDALVVGRGGWFQLNLST